jgi:hypothetical protein
MALTHTRRLARCVEPRSFAEAKENVVVRERKEIVFHLFELLSPPAGQEPYAAAFKLVNLLPLDVRTDLAPLLY